MADELARLGLVVDAQGVIRADKALTDFNRTAATAEQRANHLNREMDSMAKFAQRASQAFGVLLAGVGLGEIVRYADAWKGVQNQLRLVTDSASQLERVQNGVVAVAKRSNSELGATASLYSTLARYSGDLVKSDTELLRITETLNKSFAVSGASADAQAGAIRQLSQALASGALRGDEFNSVNENAPRIMDAVAKSLNMTKGELRTFAAEGGITSEIIINAVREMAAEIDRDFNSMDRTFAQYVQNARTNLTEFLGSNEQVQAATKAAGEALLAMSQSLDVLVTAGEGLAVVIAARQVPALAAYIASATTATTVTNVYGQRVVVATAAQRAMTATTTALNGAMALLGGPAGLFLLASYGVVRLVTSLESYEERSRSLRGEIDSLTDSQTRSNLAFAQGELEAARASMLRAERAKDRSEADRLAYESQAARVADINERIAAYEARLEKLRTGGLEPATEAVEAQAEATAAASEKVSELITALAIEQSQLHMTGREQAIFNALLKAGADASAEERQQIAELAGALYDQQEALRKAAEEEERRAKAAEDAADRIAKAHAETARQIAEDYRDLREDLSTIFQDVIGDAQNAGDIIEGIFKRTALSIAGDFAAALTLDALGANPTGEGFSFAGSLSNAGAAGKIIGAGLTKFAPGLAASLGLVAPGSAAAVANASAGYVGLMQANGAAIPGAAAGASGGLSGALGAIPGWGWALGGAALLGTMFSKKSTPSFNAGLLLEGLPGIGGQFSVDPFASGLNPVGFTRRADEAEARQVIDTFRALDQSVVDLVRALGGNIEANRGTFSALDERGLGSGLFFGAAGEKGRPGMALEQQLELYVRQLLGAAEGLDEELLAAVRSASSAEQALALLTEAVAKKAAEDEAATRAAEEAVLAAAELAAAEEQLAAQRRQYQQDYWEFARSGTDSALNVLRESVQAEKNLRQAAHNDALEQIRAEAEQRAQANQIALNAAQSGLQALESELQGISAASDALRATYMPEQVRAGALATLRSALLTGDFSGTGAAAGIAGQVNADDFATLADFRREQARTLALLGAVGREGDQQVDFAEQTVRQLEEQIKLIERTAREAEQAERDRYEREISALESQLTQAEEQVLVLRGIETGVLSLTDALTALAAALTRETAAQGAVTHQRPNDVTDAQIQDAFRSIQSSSATERDAVLRTAALAQQHGVGTEQLAGALGVSPSEVRALAEKYGIPGFATGGISTGPDSGYLTELHGTEAIVPLPNGRSIPVEMSGDMQAVLERIEARLAKLEGYSQATAHATTKDYQLNDRRWREEQAEAEA